MFGGSLNPLRGRVGTRASRPGVAAGGMTEMAGRGTGVGHVKGAHGGQRLAVVFRSKKGAQQIKKSRQAICGEGRV